MPDEVAKVFDPACGCGGTVFVLYGGHIGLFAVMPGLVPGIHDFLHPWKQDVDGWDKPGHDGACEQAAA